MTASLPFLSRHAALVGNSLKRQAGTLRKLASTSLGYDRQTFRATYIRTGRSKVEYGATSWLPLISKSTLEKLERSQRYAGPSIIDQHGTTAVEAIHAEANLPSIKTRTIQLRKIAMEK